MAIWGLEHWYLVLDGDAVGRGFEPQSNLELFFAEILISLSTLTSEAEARELGLSWSDVEARAKDKGTSRNLMDHECGMQISGPKNSDIARRGGHVITICPAVTRDLQRMYFGWLRLGIFTFERCKLRCYRWELTREGLWYYSINSWWLHETVNFQSTPMPIIILNFRSIRLPACPRVRWFG
jgi:hypothetical protein